MKFETYLLLAFLLYGVWKTNRTVQRSRTAQERFFAVRTSIFFWFVGFALLAALLFLPTRVLALLLVPVFLGGVSVAKFFQNARTRLQREQQDRVDIERMKRVN